MRKQLLCNIIEICRYLIESYRVTNVLGVSIVYGWVTGELGCSVSVNSCVTEFTHAHLQQKTMLM